MPDKQKDDEIVVTPKRGDPITVYVWYVENPVSWPRPHIDKQFVFRTSDVDLTARNNRAYDTTDAIREYAKSRFYRMSPSKPMEVNTWRAVYSEEDEVNSLVCARQDAIKSDPRVIAAIADAEAKTKSINQTYRTWYDQLRYMADLLKYLAEVEIGGVQETAQATLSKVCEDYPVAELVLHHAEDLAKSFPGVPPSTFLTEVVAKHLGKIGWDFDSDYHPTRKLPGDEELLAMLQEADQALAHKKANRR